MKKLVSLVLISLAAQAALAAPLTHAATITPQPVSSVTEPNIIITSFGGSSLLDFAELYNQGDTPVKLEGMQLQFTVTDIAPTGANELTVPVNAPDGWLLPLHYLSFERSAAPQPGLNSVAYQVDQVVALAGFTTPQLTAVNLLNADATTETSVALPSGAITNPAQWYQHKQRTKSTLQMSGVLAADYAVKTTAPALFSDPLYMPPADAAGLTVSEILANAASCAPQDTGAKCGDYIKLYNGGLTAVDVSAYRLRSDSGGSKSSSTNTFHMSGMLLPGKYFLIQKRDSGDLLSLTNTGGYVWLEDSNGVQVYDPVYSYPDASADSKKGMSWALDGSDGQWKWMVPAPAGVNYWAPQVLSAETTTSNVPVSSSSSSTSLADCGPGRERNPATNRCRTIIATATTAPTLTPCKAGQERNPDTNRCRSIVSATTALAACDEGETRNPATNRCKKVTTATLASLKPCDPGQTRNPVTNRCKKDVVSSTALANVKDVKTTQAASHTSWWITGAAVLAAVAYGLYEWRQDIMQKLRRFGLRRRDQLN